MEFVIYPLSGRSVTPEFRSVWVTPRKPEVTEHGPSVEIIKRTFTLIVMYVRLFITAFITPIVGYSAQQIEHNY